ncbi:response regulator [Roseomonas sp. SSH11]|uniref:Response regulator n=1 Tax=Pararoseomonas baculiformis TaxID=2820812 RepID=A0ABS4AKR9_9PROT|nr:response regulator [Pararoseomonas baculiformis]MBP0447632.1 response regulator [Pararoseomonas baculiformis]
MSGTEDTLRGRRILVVEDEYMIADELTEALEEAGAEVVGPVARVGRALDLARGERDIAGALLDVSLGGEMVWPVLDTLTERGVPAVLVTGFDAGVVPPAYARLPRCEKPVAAQDLLRTLAREIRG